MYVYMPFHLIYDDQLFGYISEERCITYQMIVLVSLAAFILGCFTGSDSRPRLAWRKSLASYDSNKVRQSGYAVGSVGLAAWLYTIENSGGFISVFRDPKGYGWSDIGYVREAAYLMIAGLIFLLSKEGRAPKDGLWRLAVICFSLPYLTQGLLGAQRGPTMLVILVHVLSWYLAKGKRPSLTLTLAGGTALAFLLLFLVTNRGNIYLGSEFELDSDVSEFFEANEANEYIFGAACVTTANETLDFFLGKRYLAQVLIRPIPRQFWPTKYEDFGIPEITQNAGVARPQFTSVVDWAPVAGAAAGMVSDVWVEMSWFSIPFLAWVGWLLGYTWRRAVWQQGQWTTLFIISTLLSVYFVSQGGEAVIFRLAILAIPSHYIWRFVRRRQGIRSRALAQ
jgi:hypothetical protein